MSNSTKVIYENPKYTLMYDMKMCKYQLFEKKYKNPNELHFILLYEFDNKQKAYEKFQQITERLIDSTSKDELESMGFVEYTKYKKHIQGNCILRKVEYENMYGKTIGFLHGWFIVKELDRDTNKIEESLVALIETEIGEMITRKFDKVMLK